MQELILKQEKVIEDLSKAIPLLQDEDLVRQLSIKKRRAEEHLIPLKKGYIPVVGGWFWDIDTKSKWGSKVVKEVIETMPEEVKKVMEEEKSSGTFDKIKINGNRRGDPLLVGTKGNKNFLLAMWVNLEGGYSVGFTMKKSPVKVGASTQ